MADATNHSEITSVVQLYIDGARDGDVGKLKEAFHPDARMFGSLAGQRFDMPIGEFFAMADGQPADIEGSYQGRITAVEQVGDAASVVVEERGYWGTVSFTDYFALSRINGEWKIVNKTFAHTGGTPPAA
jgi:hypothetical protein